MNGLNSMVTALLAAVLNSFWQSAAATVMVWLVLRYAGFSAAARHRVWWAWLAVLLILPSLSPAGRPGPQPLPVPVSRAAEPDVPRLPAVIVRARPAPGVEDAPVPVRIRAREWPVAVFTAWLALLGMGGVRLAWSFLHVRRLKRNAEPANLALQEKFDAWIRACGVRRPARLLVSSQLASPMAVGFRRPAVILPAALMDHLGAGDLDHVMLHELAHLARRDDWTNLAARLAGAAVGWHPAAAWVLRQVDREREIACDDWVVAATGAPRPYAASLARLFELCRSQRSYALATGMANRGSHLGDRIEMLVRRTGRAGRASLPRIATCIAMLLVLLVAGVRAPRWVAFAQEGVPRWAGKPLPPPSPQSFLAALVAAGYGDLPVDDIIALKDRGVSAEFLRGVAQAGWGRLAVQQLVDLHSRGVSPEYLRELRTSGIADLNVQGVIDLRSRGVPAEFPREIHALGFGPYTAQQIADLASHGVRLELFRTLKEGGFTRLTPGEIFEAQNSGLQAANMREAKQYGPTLSLGQIIRLKRAGVI